MLTVMLKGVVRWSGSGDEREERKRESDEMASIKFHKHIGYGMGFHR